MLRFATAGSPLSIPPPGGTLEGIRRVKELELNAMEIEWVRRVPSSPKAMEEIRKTAEGLGIKLTAHAPYYVNLNAKEQEKLSASIKRVVKALEMAQIAGAASVCVHPAFYLGMEKEEVYEHVKKAAEAILKFKTKLFPDVNLAFETMGKPSQFGTLEEVLKLSKEFGIYPCIDFAHMHARTNGKFNSPAEFNDVIGMYEEYLGKKSLSKMHLHYSGIEYTLKGERRHLPLNKSDANWKELLSVLKQRNVGGVLVCESPIMEKDTLLMQREYTSLN